MSKLTPSLLAANTLYLGEAVRRARDAGCDALHLDIMDGAFVRNLSFGPALVKDLRRETDQYLDVHLMLRRPLDFIDVFVKNGANGVTVHEEAEGFAQALERIRALGAHAGASLKPATPASTLAPHLDALDRVLLMTVEPGFGGQTLMEDVLGKARELRALGFAGEIEADGGITAKNAPLLARMGVNRLVMGTAFFSASDPRLLVKIVGAL